MWNDMENMEENSEKRGKILKKIVKWFGKYGLTFLPYFPYHFTIQPTFLPYFSYLLTIFVGIFQIFSLFNLSFFYGKYGRK
jgi:hypothetical protein